ncbi:MAG: YjzC family protein [Minicystis sp.]
MAKVGDRFYTGQRCDTGGSYVFDGYYPNGEKTPSPTDDERVIPMTKGGDFPPIRSQSRSAWWKLQRIA